MPSCGFAVQFLGGGEGTGQAQRQRVGVGVHDSAHELGEGAKGVAIILGEGVLDSGDVLLQAFGGEPLKKLLLGGVATVEGTDAYASAFGYSGDRSARISYEHFSSWTATDIPTPFAITRINFVWRIMALSCWE